MSAAGSGVMSSADFPMAESSGAEASMAQSSPAETSMAQSSQAEGEETLVDATRPWRSYKEIAPKFSLDPEKRGDDIPSSPMIYARLSDNVFWNILDDLQMTASHHGLRDFWSNEEARDHYSFAHFSRLLSLFSGSLLSTPDIHLQNPGWRERRYAVGDAITFLFLEIDSKTRFIHELLDHLAILLSRCYAIHITNRQNGFDTPIRGVFSDGDSFKFFEINDFMSACEPYIFFSKFKDDYLKVPIATGQSRWSPNANVINTGYAVVQIRVTCEAIYGTLLRAYLAGVSAHLHRINTNDSEKWNNAKAWAVRACDEAQRAWYEWHKHGAGCEDSRRLANRAEDSLSNSVLINPIRTHLLLPGLTEEMAAI